jgi:hypothetical protein
MPCNLIFLALLVCCRSDEDAAGRRKRKLDFSTEQVRLGAWHHAFWARGILRFDNQHIIHPPAANPPTQLTTHLTT